ncbi:M24 family metallopeptidase [Chloroflexota bacterium]
MKQWPNLEYWGAPSWAHISNYTVAHGVGLELHERPRIVASLGETNPITLEENMVIALETLKVTEDGKEAARPEEMVVVTKDGYELLAKFPITELTEAWI